MKPIHILITASLILSSSAWAKIIGKVNRVRLKNNKIEVQGWACDEGRPESIQIKLYVDGGSFSGLPRGTFRANKNSSKSINEKCGSGIKHNFLVNYDASYFHSFSNKKLVVYGVNNGKSTKLPAPRSPNTNVLPDFEKYGCNSSDENNCVYPNVSKENTVNILDEDGLDAAKKVTHQLSFSNNTTLGINSNGGGYITKLHVPGIGNILKDHSPKYGRGGQSSIRDDLHSGKYNPTQAGFSDPAGTDVEIEKNSSNTRLTILPRHTVGYNGDQKYDYCEETNLADDNYDNPGLDDDGIVENISQAREVQTEFDYYGYYEKCSNVSNVSCFRHYYEYRFVRGTSESHFMTQFFKGVTREKKNNPSKPILTDGIVDQYSVNYPESWYSATQRLAKKDDLAKVNSRWTLRFDNSVWNPTSRFYVKKSDSVPVRDSQGRVSRYNSLDTGTYYNGFILSKSASIDNAQAVGIFKILTSDINTDQVVLRKFSNKGGIYKSENRMIDGEQRIQDTISRLGTETRPIERKDNMSMIGFREQIRGLKNPDNINDKSNTNLGERRYETLRSEIYIFVGSPREIGKALKNLMNK